MRHCEYRPAHPDVDVKDAPEAVTLQRVDRLDNPEGATSSANVLLCADCAEREGTEPGP